MKNLDLNNYGVQEMNATEMRDVDGGIFPLIVIAAACLLTSCTFVVGDNNTVGTSVKADSTANGNSAGQGSGNKVR